MNASSLHEAPRANVEVCEPRHELLPEDTRGPITHALEAGLSRHAPVELDRENAGHAITSN